MFFATVPVAPSLAWTAPSVKLGRMVMPELPPPPSGVDQVSSPPAQPQDGLFGLGFAGGLYIPSAIATITSLIERPHWGKAIAVHELAPNLAFFAGPFVAELFLSWSTWRLALSALGMAALMASFAYCRFGRGGEFAGESPA